MADDCKHGEGQHDQRDVPVPAVPGPALMMVKPQFGLGGLETVVSRPKGFHLQPLAEPDVNLSAHPAPIIQLTTRMS
jgi:hypothetical protein